MRLSWVLIVLSICLSAVVMATGAEGKRKLQVGVGNALETGAVRDEMMKRAGCWRSLLFPAGPGDSRPQYTDENMRCSEHNHGPGWGGECKTQPTGDGGGVCPF